MKRIKILSCILCLTVLLNLIFSQANITVYAAPNDWILPWSGICALTTTDSEHNRSYYYGLDFATYGGYKIDLYAPTSGYISLNEYDSSFGYHINITTDDGYIINMAHLDVQSWLAVGSRVALGQRVGIMGTTGDSNGVHLHFDIKNSSGAKVYPASLFGRSISAFESHADFYGQVYPMSSITFDSAGGSAVASITQDVGSSIPWLANPTKAGCRFLGWLPGVPATMPANDLTCVAQWTQLPVVLSVSNATGAANSDVVVSINMPANSGLAAASFYLSYDTNKLTYKSSAEGVAAAYGLTSVNPDYSVNGNIKTIYSAYIDDTGDVAAGSMLDITFTIKNGWTGSTPVNLAVGDFIDMYYTNVPYTVSNGSVSVRNDLKKAIYFLPGYMGSKLYSTSTKNMAWMSKPVILADIVNFNNHFGSAFSLDENGNGNLMGVDRVKDNAPNGNGLYSYGTTDISGKDTAANIMGTLKSNFLKQNGGDYDTVKFFSYDWRKSLKEAADDLQADINSRGYDKVTIVTHSTGGLLAAEYIAASTANQQKVEKVVTLGAPLLGTYSALTPLETGKADFVEEMLGDLGYPLGVYNWIMNLTKNTPCTYQLLPSNEFVSMCPIGVTGSLGTGYHSVNNINGFYSLLNRSTAGLNQNMTNGSGESHKKYRETYVKGNIMNVFKKVEAYHIAGVEPKNEKNLPIYTEISAKYVDSFNYGTGPVKFNGYNHTTNGDGTITQISACGIYKNNNGEFVFPERYGLARGVDHGGLVNNTNVLNVVVDYIKHGTAAYNINSPKSASQAITSTDELITTGAGMSDALVYRLSGNVDISILDSAGTQVAFLNKEMSEGFSENGISYNYISIDMNEVDLLLPNNGFQVVVTPSADASGTVDFSAVLSTLQDDGGTEATVEFASPLQVGEKLVLDAVSGITKDNITDVVLLLTKSDLSTVTVAPAGIKTDYATSLTIDETAEIVSGNTVTINAVVEPAGAGVNWQSSDENVVTVDANGNATAVGYGKAQITAITGDGSKFATCYVTVPCLAESISYSLESLVMTTDENTFITPVFTPAYATNTVLTYSSDNEAVASVDADGMVSALKPGTAVITATTDNGKTANCNVTVENDSITATQSSTLLVNENDGFITNISTANDSVEKMRGQIGNTNIRFLDASGNSIPENSSLGTGARLQLLDREGTVIDELTIIIYGDVNGDGVIDTSDADTIVDIGNYALPQWDPVTDAAYIKACDLFRDGVIDENDCVVLKDVQNYALTLDQSTGEAT